MVRMGRTRRGPKSHTSSPPSRCTAAEGAHRVVARMNARINLLGLDLPALEAFFAGLGEKPFRARQVARWVHQRFEGDIGAMSDLARPLREKLAGIAEVAVPRVISD